MADERLQQSIAAAEHERHRWARELHDETLQGLGALRLLLASARKSGQPRTLERTVGQAVGQIEAQIRGLRALIADLRPAALDEIGLAGAVEGLVERVATEGSLEVEAKIGLAQAERLRPEVELTLYRLAQEALTNVVKHASATRVSVHMVERHGSIDLTVADNGRGFDPADGSTGFGLVGMRERAALAGGRLSISSSAGAGSTVRAEVPALNRAPANQHGGTSLAPTNPAT